MTPSPLVLSRLQILHFRQRVGSLDGRMPLAAKALRRAAWCGLQDSMPRAALLSIHARVASTVPTSWEHSSLLQLWGPRFSIYVVAAKDLAVFSLGRLPEDARGRARAHDIASRLHAFLDGRRMPLGRAGHEMGVPPNSLRYAAPTGRLLVRWDGARDTMIWTAPAPDMEPQHARLELARRYLHVFGPATAASFAGWSGIRPATAVSTFTALGRELMPVRTPLGDAWILADDAAALEEPARPSGIARFLPSGDAYYLLWGADRKLLVPDTKQRAALWTSRVWPGALLVNGEIVGVWRRSAGAISITAWRRLARLEREAVETEAAALPLPGPGRPITVGWC